MKTSLFSIIAGSFCFSVGTAAIDITIFDSGSNVVMETAGGALDTSALGSQYTLEGGIPGVGGDMWNAVFAGGPPASIGLFVDETTITYAGKGMTGQIGYGADSVTLTGDYFGAGEGVVAVPSSYTSGSIISGSSITFNNASISDIGWSAGDSGTWSWIGDSITLTAVAVPEPSQYVIFLGVFTLGICAFRRRARRL